MRKVAPPAAPAQSLPVDDESRLSLLKVFKDAPDREQPLLSLDLEETLSQLIQERRQTKRLVSMGLTPTRSAIFVGPPGVGKTLTARCKNAMPAANWAALCAWAHKARMWRLAHWRTAFMAMW